MESESASDVIELEPEEHKAMLAYKNLLLIAEKVIAVGELEKSHDDLKKALEMAARESREFLVSSKSFEYSGPLEMKYGAAIKLKDFKMDFDDVLRNVFNKRTDIEGQVYLSLVVLPEKGDSDAKSDKTTK